ncbi:MAG: AraC family transcriptional regulator [Clostridiales bacterium]|jgi:AraC-like DNA-binding protein|nr:AraC family transcriptional regulator [Clostridiales bacterium]
MDFLPDTYYRSVSEDREALFRHTPYRLEQELVSSIVAGDTERALNTLSLIENSGEKAVLADDSLRSAKNSVICSATFFARAAIQSGVDAAETFALSDSVIRCIETQKTRADVLAYEKTALLAFINLVNRSATSRYSAPVGRAVHYIETRLDKRVTLIDIARYAQVNPKYLCGVFRKEMGMTPVQFMNTRKIQESVYFVKNRAYRLADVALIYGFSSQSYFTAVFKKVMGITPGEMRDAENL